MHFFNDQGGRKNWKQSATTLQLFSWGIRSTCSLKLLSKWFIWCKGYWGYGEYLAGVKVTSWLENWVCQCSTPPWRRTRTWRPSSTAWPQRIRAGTGTRWRWNRWAGYIFTKLYKCSTFQFLSEVQGSFLFLYKSLTCGFKGVDLSPNLMMHIVNCLFINFHSQSLLLSITNF